MQSEREPMYLAVCMHHTSMEHFGDWLWVRLFNRTCYSNGQFII